MENLLKLAAIECDRAEVYVHEQTSHSVTIEDGHLKDITSTLLQGLSLRVVRDGFIGMAYTKNMRDPELLVKNALSALRGKVSAPGDFPAAGKTASLKTWDEQLSQAATDDLASECDRICRFLTSRTEGQINIMGNIDVTSVRVLNTSGTDLLQKSTWLEISPELLFPGGYSAISRAHETVGLEPVPDHMLYGLLKMYNCSKEVATLSSGKYPVIFLPECMYTLMWRLKSATNGRNIYLGNSPLGDRLGEKIFAEQMTISDDPLDDRFPGARSFDDEGTPTQVLPVVQDGVLKHFHYDLTYGHKLQQASTGHGYRTVMWGGDAVTLTPIPALQHLTVVPGSQSLEAMIRSIDKGIIVCGAMGAHSGNIPNGDFSIGVSPGLLIEKGAIAAQVKDVMVAGNIYDIFQRVTAIEDQVHPAWGGVYPAILFDDVSIAGQ